MSELVSGGLATGSRCVVIATAAHRQLFTTDLAQRGIDVAAVLENGDLVALDAEATLAQFMVGEQLDAARFQSVVGSMISRTASGGRKVRAFGEMVDVLWRDGKVDAALELERMWTDLARSHDFDLLCAYTVSNLFKTSAGRFSEICELHDHAHEVERGESDSTRMLIHEIARRANVERELREKVEALQRSEEAERRRAIRNLKLQQATAALAGTVSLGELSDMIVSTTAQLLGAVATRVYLLDDKPARLPADSLLAHAITTRRSVWIETRDQLRDRFPQVAEDTAASKHHATAAIPLVHGTHVVGALSLWFETQRSFTDEERAWLESFAMQCSLAVDRVRLHVAEHKARNEAENLLRIAESLNDMHLDLEAILQRVTDEATALVGAQFGAFFYNVENDRGESYMLCTLSGARKEQLAKLGMPRNTAIFAHTFNGIGTVRIDDVKQDPRYGKSAPHHGMPPGHLLVTSYLAVPVRSRTGKIIGGLFFGHEEAAKFTAQHEQSLRALAVTAAIAIDNAELYRAARDAEDSQRKTVEQLVDTVRMNELFTGVLAHDLRSPLSAVTTGSEVLLVKANDGDRRIAERILTSGRRMARMIEQLLDFTRIRVGTGLPVDAKACDVQTLLGQVIDELRIAHPKQPIAFNTLGNTMGCWDEDRLAQAFSNLIGNAAQHGVPEAAITVSVDGTEPSQLAIRIQNAGAIPDALLPQVFEPMVGGQRRRDGSRGLGIGLYITREIVRSHGGTITVESTPETGTAFTFTLPREVASVETSPRDVQPAPSAPRSDEIRRVHTLVDGVRDHAIFMLDASGHVLTWTPTAERITGFDREAILSRSIGVLYTAESTNLLDTELGRTAKLATSEHEGWLRRQDGAQFWASVSLSAIRDASGALAGFAAVMRDLTNQREARLKLDERDARMRLMIDSVRDYAIFMLDADGNVASWNRGAQLTKGYTPGEIIGRHISLFYTRDDRAAGRAQALLARAVADGRVEDEGWRIRKDGSRFWADVVITALRDDDGKLCGFAKVTRDLTDRRAAEEELRRSEERFRLLVESVKDYAIFLLDPTGHVVTWNAGAERNKGYKAYEIVGQHFSKFYEPEEVRAGKCERELEIATRDGRFEEEGWRLRKDGTRFWANVVITPLRGASGTIMGFAKVTRDLTERKSLEDVRLRAVQAQEGIRLRDEFLSIVSHELKTPLAGLLLQIEAAAHRAAVDPKTRDKLLRARESGERLDDLIETLLDVSRIATGRFVLDPDRLDLVALVRDVSDSFQLSAAKAGCEIRITAPAKLLGSWDRVRMSQVIANLLSNAIKYGAGKPIEIAVASDDREAVVTVRDHGPGIDPTVQSRIFDRFERAVSARHYGGLGIGLYVVREIVAAHGGTAGVESSPGDGARFTLRLPVETLA